MRRPPRIAKMLSPARDCIRVIISTQLAGFMARTTPQAPHLDQVRVASSSTNLKPSSSLPDVNEVTAVLVGMQ
jgi:hypothetical protein